MEQKSRFVLPVLDRELPGGQVEIPIHAARGRTGTGGCCVSCCILPRACVYVVDWPAVRKQRRAKGSPQRLGGAPARRKIRDYGPRPTTISVLAVASTRHRTHDEDAPISVVSALAMAQLLTRPCQPDDAENPSPAANRRYITGGACCFPPNFKWRTSPIPLACSALSNTSIAREIAPRSRLLQTFVRNQGDAWTWTLDALKLEPPRPPP